MFRLEKQYVPLGETKPAAQQQEPRDARSSDNHRMGKLAERYTDAARSGVYRVTDAAVPRAAAAEARALLVETSAEALADGRWKELRDALEAGGRPACVALIGEAASFVARRADDYTALLAALETQAHARRAAGEPFFAVMVDPRGALALPLLYKER